MSARGRLVPPGAVQFRPYPVRVVPRMNWVDRNVRFAAARLRIALRPRRLGRRALVAAVMAEAAGWQDATDLALRRAGDALRARLSRDGLSAANRVAAMGLAAEAIRRVTGLSPRPVQVYGASLLLDGRLLEMATGEGKSLTALLAAAVAGLAGWNPHVVTVNDYLAARDHEDSRPVLARLGLSAGCVTSDRGIPERRAAYACDVVHVTNKDVAFDYLKDRVAMGGVRDRARRRLRQAFGGSGAAQPPILRGLRFAIVDEADSIFIDEARTPLIISASGQEAPDPAPFETALALSRRLAQGRDFTVEDETRRIRLTEAGRTRIGDLVQGLDGLWAIPAAREERLRQALSARLLFARDAQYILAPDADTGAMAVVIIDEFTGRAMPDRSWEGGLHQMIEVKEGLPPTAPRETLARVTFQRFFRGYLRLSGMTGTGMEVAAELRSFFDLETIAVPPHRASRRRHLGARLLPDSGAKMRAIATRTAGLVAAGRPVLIGTRTVEASEAVAAALAEAGVPHTVLNARQDGDEAGRIAQAGEAGRVTVATNMAGRGTDIKLSAAARAAGGLHVILTEYHESRRIDRQLYGRAGRQGDPGSAEDIVARDDALFARFAPRLTRVMQAVPGAVAAGLLRSAMQARAEREAAAQRRRQLEGERDLQRFLALSGSETDS